MIRSLKKTAANTDNKERLKLPIEQAPKSAMALIAVKFGGCGKNLLKIPNKINPKIAKKRALFMLKKPYC